MDRPGARRALHVLVALLLAALPLAVLVAVRALPPVDVETSGVAWLPTALVVVLAVVAALAALAALVTGLRRASISALLSSGSSATLAGGAVAVLAGASSLAPAAFGAAGLGLAAALSAGRVVPGGTAAQVGAAVGAMLGAEALALLAILLPGEVLATLEAPLLAGAAGLAVGTVVASANRRGTGAGLLAVGALGLLADRGGSLELLMGLAALAAAQLLALVDALSTPDAEPADDRLPELARRLADAVLRFDGHLRLRDWNQAAAGLLGLDSASIGTRIEDLLGVSVADLPGPEAISVTHGGVGGLEVAMHRSGTGLIAVIRDPGAVPEAERLVSELRTTIEELLRARRTIELQRGELEQMAAIDPLTGVASRSAILERVRIEVAEARRYRHPLAVVLLDVDRLGEINRVHGVAGGDSVLREVALRIRLRVRDADALGRAGSDGFLAALPHTDEAGAATFADALRHRLALRPVTIGDETVAVTVSIGVATMRPGEDLDLDGLLARVEEALDSARAAGGDRIALDRLHGLARLEDPHERATDPGSDSDAAG